MGAEQQAAVTVAEKDRYRQGIEYPNPLAGNPVGSLAFATSVTQKDGSDLAVACPWATRLAVACMNMNAVLGGAACHWGGPSAFAEIMSAIHGIMFSADDWRVRYNFINDAGHTENGLYALKANYGYAGVDYQALKGFRSIASKLTGHGESHLFKEGVMISNGPLGSSLPMSQGLALADRIANNDRVTICTISDGAMMEGEAREAIAAIPGLASKDRLNPYLLVVSDNNTKLSGRIDQDAFSMQPTFSALESMGWSVVEVADGHDLQAVFTAVEAGLADVQADRRRPVALWVKTIKGYGVKKTEESSSGGHGYPLSKAPDLRGFCQELVDRGFGSGKEIPQPFSDWIAELEANFSAKQEAAAAKPAASGVKKDKIQSGFPKAMMTCAQEGLPVVSVSADLQGSTGIAPFHAQFPQFAVEVGVAESNMVSTAGGLSKHGYIPVVDTFAQFGVTKGALPLTMATLSQSPIIAVFSHAGFQDAADGASHQGLTYMAMLAAIPGVQLYCPASAEEAEWAMEHAIRSFAADRQAGKTPDSVIFFCGREGFPVSLKPQGQEYAWGQAQVVADTSAGKDRVVTISAVGSMVSRALDASAQLEASGIGAIVLSNSTPNAPDLAAHGQALQRSGGKLITVEDHQAIGGAGSLLISAMVQQGECPTVKVLGVQGEFGRSAYQADELYDHYGIGAKAIVAAAQDMA
ncbi:MAG: transketolase [Planctomycetota bacterium]|nr:MAG: transketolase [Planctomycetota bacterium]